MTPDQIRQKSLEHVVQLAGLIDDEPDTLASDIKEADPIKDDDETVVLLVETEVSTFYLYYITQKQAEQVELGKRSNEYVLDVGNNEVLALVEV